MSNAAGMLRERLVQCESANLLGTNKDFCKIEADKLKGAVLACQGAWHKFDMSIKLKLCRHASHVSLAAISPSECSDFLSEVFTIEGVNFGDEKTAFEPLKPTFPDFIQNFVWSVRDIMAQEGLLRDAEVDEELEIGIQALSAEEKKNKMIEENAELKKLKQLAKETQLFEI